MSSTHSSTSESMPRARKSTLIKRASSHESLSHWQTTRPGMPAFSSGTSSTRGRDEITIPPTCWEMWRGNPEISSARAIRSRQSGASTLSRNSGSESITSRSRLL